MVIKMPGWLKINQYSLGSRKLSKYPFLLLRINLLIVLYAFCRLIFYVYNAELFPEISSGDLFNIFIGGLRFDLVGILYLNILYFTAILLPFRFVYHKNYQRVWDAVFITFNLAGLLANCFDVIYFPYTLKRTTSALFRMVEHEQNLVTILIRGLYDYWPLTLFLLIMLLAIVLLIKTVKIKKSGSPAAIFYSVQSIFLLVLIYLMISGIRGGFGRYTRPLAMNDAGQYVNSPDEMPLVLNTPFTIIRTLRQKKLSIKNYFKSQQELEAYFNPLQFNKSDGPVNKKNVIILILESFGREYSGKLNKGYLASDYQGYTPFLDSLMDHSLTFYNAYANGRKSIDGIPAVITGIPFLGTHYVISNYGTNTVGGLGHVLNQFGYYSAFFHGAPNGSMGFNSFTKIAGIEDYFGKDEFNNDDFYDGTWGIWDEEFLQFMAAKADNFETPFFIGFFGVSSHSPFDLPERYEGKFKEGPIKILKTIGYTDYALKQFFKTVSKSSWYDNSLFVITADHASVSFNKEYKNHIGSNAIPIIFFTPDGSLKGKSYDVAQQADIFPTIVDYLNFDTEYFSFGSSLLDSTKNRKAFYYSSESYKFIEDSLVLQYKHGKVVSLYNYKSDPLFTNNLINDIAGKSQQMENKLRAVIQQFDNRMINNAMYVK